MISKKDSGTSFPIISHFSQDNHHHSNINTQKKQSSEYQFENSPKRMNYRLLLTDTFEQKLKHEVFHLCFHFLRRFH